LDNKSKKVDFDKYAEDYENILKKDLVFFESENSYFSEYKVKITRKVIPDEPAEILEFGCGTGRNLKYLREYFPASKLEGCDISQKSLDISADSNKKTELFLIDGNFTKNRTNRYDLIFISNVYHHIKPEERKSTTGKIADLLKHGGKIMIFEHNPYNLLTRYIVDRCPFDEDAVLLKPKELKNLLKENTFCIKQFKYTLFFPRILKIFRPIESFIGFIPAGGQYYILAEKI